MKFTYFTKKRPDMLRGQKELYGLFEGLAIQFEYHEHPPLATIEDAKIHWKNYNSGRCKNIFFRNHKGDRHYLVILEHLRQLNVKDLEKRIRQGKLTFASDKRLNKYLGVEPGSVSPFGLINDKEKHVHVFIDEKLNEFDRLTFHPNINTASITISKSDFFKFLEHTGNTYEFIRMYD
jgi:Ala-tRNA(Pro) deacylase